MERSGETEQVLRSSGRPTVNHLQCKTFIPRFHSSSRRWRTRWRTRWSSGVVWRRIRMNVSELRPGRSACRPLSVCELRSREQPRDFTVRESSSQSEERTPPAPLLPLLLPSSSSPRLSRFQFHFFQYSHDFTIQHFPYFQFTDMTSQLQECESICLDRLNDRCHAQSNQVV